jgi:hypothetical protein
MPIMDGPPDSRAIGALGYTVPILGKSHIFHQEELM